MAEPPYNPYAPPYDLPHQYRISFSAPLRDAGIGMCLLVGIQSLTGMATALVVSQEGTAAHGFVVGMALWTMILAALIGYAGSSQTSRRLSRAAWGLFVTVVAWTTWLFSLWLMGRSMSQPAVVSQTDLFRVVFMAAVTVVFVLLFLVRTSPAADTGTGTPRA